MKIIVIAAKIAFMNARWIFEIIGDPKMESYNNSYKWMALGCFFLSLTFWWITDAVPKNMQDAGGATVCSFALLGAIFCLLHATKKGYID